MINQHRICLSYIKTCEMFSTSGFLGSQLPVSMSAGWDVSSQWLVSIWFPWDCYPLCAPGSCQWSSSLLHQKTAWPAVLLDVVAHLGKQRGDSAGYLPCHGWHRHSAQWKLLFPGVVRLGCFVSTKSSLEIPNKQKNTLRTEAEPNCRNKLPRVRQA